MARHQTIPALPATATSVMMVCQESAVQADSTAGRVARHSICKQQRAWDLAAVWEETTFPMCATAAVVAVDLARPVEQGTEAFPVVLPTGRLRCCRSLEARAVVGAPWCRFVVRAAAAAAGRS